MRRIDTLFPVIAVADTVSDVRRLLEEVDFGTWGIEPGECVPPIDVIETDEALQVVVDLPGVVETSIHVLLKGGLLIVAGVKEQPRGTRDTTFHLVERTFGRFARGVPIATAFDGGRATARLAHGELLITLPKLVERRGRRIPVRIVTE
jgi:HSP20 family protein